MAGVQPAMRKIAVFTMALGLAATTAVFSVVRSVLLAPLPYANPAGLVMLWNHWTGWPSTWLSNAEFADYRDKARSFSGVGAYSTGERNLTGGDVPERIRVGMATASVFTALGTPAALGRTYTEVEDMPGAPRVAMISDGLWRRRFAADPGIAGKTILLDDSSTTVIGVMPAGFQLPLDFGAEPMDLWVPLALGTIPAMPRGGHYLNVVARLRPGVTPAAAEREVRALSARMVADYPTYDPTFGAFTRSVSHQVLGDVRPTLVLLLGAVGCVLLIACANVANLLLSRAHAREREMVIRATLGASPGRLVRELVGQSVGLSLVSGAIGVVMAAIVVRVIAAIAPPTIPRIRDVTVDGTALAFAVCVSLITGLICGLAPALRARRTNLQRVLASGGRGSTMDRAGDRVRRVLVAAEVALSVLLLVGAGLLLESFVRLQGVDPGFTTTNVLTARVGLPIARYPDTLATRAFYRRAVDRIRSLPGVTAAGLVRVLPMTDVMGDWDFTIEGQTSSYAGDWQVVSPDYFRVMGIGLKDGRYLTDADDARGPNVVLVNEALARRAWPDGRAVGQVIHMGGGASAPRTVVGIVADIRHRGLDADPRPELYLPHEQWATGSNAGRVMYIVLKSARDPRFLIADVRHAIQSLDPNVPLADVRTMDDVLRGWTAARRLALSVLAMLAGAALVLAAVGLYGVVSYGVSQRTSEIGIRRALGAQPTSVLALVARQGSMPVVIGVAIGLAGAFGATRLISAMLFQTKPGDPVIFCAVPVLLGAVATVATFVPARRAVRVDPLIALRSE
jgi:putative ABC transport system permease protein